MYWLAALAAFSCAGSVFALGLGEVEGRAIVGQRLNITIPILGDIDNSAQADCAAVLPVGDDDGRDRIRIKVEGDRVSLSTALGLTQPILQFRIRLGCGGSFERGFVVLPEPPGTRVPVNLPRSAASPRATVDTPPVLPKSAPLASGQPSIVLASTTTLRMLSRQRYPGDSRARVRFIRQLAAANTDLFASEQAAFDQRLAEGTRLLMPPGLPALSSAKPVAASARIGTASVASRRVTAQPLAGERQGQGQGVRTGRGRLIVGAVGLSAAAGPSASELNESIDRLVEVMNQQVMVQIAMTERVKAVEAELAELKSQFGAEKARTAKLESALKAEREAVERGGTIQLMLLILLGGLAGAWTLSWMSRRKESAAVIPLATVSPEPTSEAGLAAPAMPSVFQDMSDEREEILPPGGLRF